MNKRILVLLLIALILRPASGLATSVEASVDRNRIGADQSVQLTVTIDGEDGEVNLSTIEDFEVTTAGTGTNVQIINGKMSRQVNHTYLLLPKKTGTLRIPALTVTIDGTDYQTRAITVAVGPQGQETDSSTGRVLLEAEGSNQAPYLGQPLVYTLRILQRVQLANAELQKPAMEGFSVEQIGEREKHYPASRAGIRYQATELRFLLSPIKTGSLEIGRALLRCEVADEQSGRRRSAFPSFFNDPFFGGRRLVTKTFRSRPLSVTVKPLPDVGRPPDYTGLIGSFTLQADLENDHPKVGDSNTLSITLQGTGNLKDALPPELKLPPSFKLYQDSPQDDIRIGTQGYTGKRVFRYALVAVQPGSYEIPPVRIDTFDPGQEAYRVLQTEPVSITVAPATEQQALHAAGTATASGRKAEQRKETVSFSGRDILPLKDDLHALDDRSPLPLQRFLFFWLLPALLYLLAARYDRLRRKTRSTAVIMTARSQQAIQEACRLDHSSEQFLTCLHRAIVAAVLAKAGTKGEALTHQEVARILTGNGGNEELAATTLHLLRLLEGFRYGGRLPDEQTRRELLEQTRHLTKALKK